MRFLICIILSLAASTTYAVVPPTMAKGQSDASYATTFNFQAPQSQVTRLNATTGLIETGNDNRLKDPGCEATATTAWTSVNGGTVVKSGANFYDGLKSCTQTPGAATGILAYQTFAPPASGYSGNFEVSAMVQNGTAGLQVCAISGTSTILTCVDALTDSLWHQYTIPYAYPGSGNVGIAFYAKSSYSSQFYWDNVYGIFGSKTITNLGAQAQGYGSQYQVGASGCSFQATNTGGEGTFVTVGAGTGCNAPTVTGGVTNASANTLQITLANHPAGRFQITLGGFLICGGAICHYRYTDGTTNFGRMSAYPNGSTSSSGPFTASVDYSAPGTHTITLQVATSGNFSAGMLNDTNRALQWDVQFFPLQSQVISTANMQPAYAGKQWLGATASDIKVGASAAASATRTVLADANLAAYTLLGAAQNDSSTNMQVTASLPAGEYEVEFSAFMRAQSAASGTATICNFDLYDGTTALGTNYVAASPQAATDYQDSTHLRGYFKTTGSSTSKTISVRAAKVGGDTSASSFCETYISSGSVSAMLTIAPKTQVTPVPIIANSVISSSPGVERVERVTFGGTTVDASNCTVSPCTVWRGSGGFTAPTRTGTGLYTAALTTPYSDRPTCDCVSKESGGSAGRGCRAWATSNSSIDIYAGYYPTDNVGTTASLDTMVQVKCQGPK